MIFILFMRTNRPASAANQPFAFAHNLDGDGGRGGVEWSRFTRPDNVRSNDVRTCNRP